ncbi:pre-peptidase C-terminal domain-containing protein, partial [Acidisoma cellulosilytica]
MSDFVGSSEPNGWYQFTLGSLSDVSLALADPLGSGSATITLTDSNGNQINVSSASAADPALFFTNLAAGTYYIHVHATSDTPFTLTSSATALPNAAGSNFAAATALAAPVATVASVSDWVGAAAPADYYKFTLTAAATVNLQLSNASDTLTLYDANGNQLGATSSSTGYPILSDALTIGTYYVAVTGTVDGAYTLSTWTGLPAVATAAAADNAGNTIAAANTTSLAALTALAKTVAGWVSSADTDDYYKFTLASLSTVSLRLSGISATDYAYLYVYDATGTQVAGVVGSNINPGSIVQDLAAGTYYIDVEDASGSGTGYSLLATPTALPNVTGKTQAAATALGTLTTTAVSKSDWVGNAAPDDYYKFTLAGLSSLSLTLTGNTNASGVVTLLNAAGNVLEYNYFAPGGMTLSDNLAAGNYYIHVSDSIDTVYTLSASETALPNAIGTTLAAATALGTLTAAGISKSDWIGSAAPEDFYKFTLSSLSTVALQLTGLSNPNETLYLLDSSGNQIAYTYYPANGSIFSADLAAGTYYIHIIDSYDTTYTLAASETALPNAAGSGLATATSVGALGATAVTKSDWVGNAAPNDYYKFTLSAASTAVTLKLATAIGSGTVYLLDSSGNQIDVSSYGTGGLASVVDTLAAGTYYVEVTDSTDTNYSLTFSTGKPTVGTAATDGAGNTLAAAKVIGALTTTPQTYADWLGAADTRDAYQFTLSSLSAVTLQVSGLAASTSDYVSLYDADGRLVTATYAGATYNGLITDNLGAGTYYAVVDYSSTNSGYSLSASAVALPNAVGTTLATATSLGTLSTTAVSVSDWVGTAAPDDDYSFTLSSLSTVAFSLAGTSNGSATLTLFDSSGNQITSVTPYAALSGAALTATLAAGTYYLNLHDTTDTTYTLTASSSTAAGTASALLAGRSLAAANTLGNLGATPVTQTDWVGQAAPDDWYQFTLASLSNVSLDLSGLLGPVTVTLTDADGNQITATSSDTGTIRTPLSDLAAGTYYIHINATTDTPFTLTAAATALPNSPSQTLAAATALAAPVATVASVSDWVGAAAPADYYKFTLT